MNCFLGVCDLGFIVGGVLVYSVVWVWLCCGLVACEGCGFVAVIWLV